MTTLQEVGAAGEDIVAEVFENFGCKVDRSEDPYDQFKDLIVDGWNVEVKTQTLYRRFYFPDGARPAFTVPVLSDTKLHRNQLSKCLNVDRLMFVQRPTQHDRAIRIYEAPPVGERHFTIIQNPRDQRYTAGFDIQQMNLFVTVEKPELEDLLMDSWRS